MHFKRHHSDGLNQHWLCCSAGSGALPSMMAGGADHANFWYELAALSFFLSGRSGVALFCVCGNFLADEGLLVPCGLVGVIAHSSLVSLSKGGSNNVAGLCSMSGCEPAMLVTISVLGGLASPSSASMMYASPLEVAVCCTCFRSSSTS